MSNRYGATQNLVKIFAVLVGVGHGAIASAPAQGQTLNWAYTYDSPNDGYGSGLLGSNSSYELYYAATASDGDRLYVAFNSNMPFAGVAAPRAQQGLVSWGDVFFNFSGQTFTEANVAGQLFSVRFVPTNDSGVPELGLYSNVTAKSVTAFNLGFQNLRLYRNRVTGAGGTPSLGVLPADTSYFDQDGPGFNVMDTGTRIGDVQALTDVQLGSLATGLGRYTYGFSVERSLLPTGEFFAHLFAECINDGVVFQSMNTPPAPKEVPEPSTLLSIGLAGGAIAFWKKRRHAAPER